jgi:predicted phage tail protein
VQLASAADFAAENLVEEISTRSRAYSLQTLTPGRYFWRVAAIDQAGNVGEYSPAWMFTYSLQLTPADGSATTDTTPRLLWSAQTGAEGYWLEIAESADFAAESLVYAGEQTGRSYTVTEVLEPGLYYWRVHGQNVPGESYSWRFTVTPPLAVAPSALSPANGQWVGSDAPLLQWTDSTSTQGQPYSYEIEVDDDSRFRSPELAEQVGGTSYAAAGLADGRYYWRIRTVNAVGAAGRWSRRYYFTVDAPATEAP